MPPTSRQGIVGEICTGKPVRRILQEGLEIEVDWKITDFCSLPKEVHHYYESPVFEFSAHSWYLKFCPGGNSPSSKGLIELYMAEGKTPPPQTLECTIGIKTSEGKVEQMWRKTITFDRFHFGSGNFILETEELSQRSDLVPSGTLTITAILQTDVQQAVGDPLSRRLRDNVFLNLKKILFDEVKSDVVLKVGDSEFPAHRLILETRSSVFATVFQQLDKDKISRVLIPGIDPEVFKLVLTYIYIGEVSDISSDNVLQVFAAADTYDLQDLKQWCSSFMKNNLSVDNVCCVLSLVDKHTDTELKQSAEEYFVKNSSKIVGTDKWQEDFSCENKALAIQLLTAITHENASKGK